MRTRTIVRGLIGFVGIFNLILGLGFFFMPIKLATAFFLSPSGSQGLATLRADFPGLFAGISLFVLYGAYRERAAPLAVPLVMMTIGNIGRIVSLLLDGAPSTAFPPIIVEWVMIAILLMGYRAFDRATQK
jgi:hypothetical protein